MGANIPTGNDEEYSEIVAENMNRGREPNWLEISGIDISEYPSSGITVGNTIIFRKSCLEFLDAIKNDVSAFDIIVQFYSAPELSWERRATIFINGRQYSGVEYSNTHYSDIATNCSKLMYTIKDILKQDTVKVLFIGIGDGLILNAFHNYGALCCGCEKDGKLLYNARQLLVREDSPWNFS